LLNFAAALPQDPAPEAEFEGRAAFSAAELRKVVAGDLDRYGKEPRPAVLDDAVFRLAQHYRARGYAFAEVEAQVRGDKIVFLLKEGPLIRLGRLHFRGNAAISGQDLKEMLERVASGRNLPYSKKLLALQAEAILASYGARGYIEASVAEPELHYVEADREVHVTYRITEGRPFTLVAIERIPPGLEEKLRDLVDRPYDPARPAEIEAAILDHFRERGHPYPVAVATPDINRETGQVKIKLDVREGPAGKIGALAIQGNDRTRAGLIEGRVRLERGSPYRASAVREAEYRLMVTGLFRQARITPGVFQDENQEVPLQVFVEEALPGEVSVRAGTGTLDGWRFGAEAAYHNLFGGGETARLGGTVSRTGERGDLELGFPWFLGSDFRPGLSLYAEQQELPSFDVTGYGVAPSVLYPFTDKHTMTAGTRYAVIRTDKVDPGVPPGDLLDFEYQALFLATSLDFRDSVLLPTRGFRVTGSVEWAPGLFASDIEFFKLSGRGDYYLPLPWDLNFALSVQGGIIRPVAGTDEIPISLRYFVGGTNSVRGFKYGTIGESVAGDPTGGEAFVSMQMEIRFRIWREVHGAVFTDRGGAWLDPEDVELDDTRWSVGTGVRYYTAAGALAADVAWNPAREEDEDAVVFHFSIGFPF
jgi:outer membrane protein insertion porin family